MSKNTSKRLAELKLGECFRVGQHEFVVLEQCDGSAAVILKQLLRGSSEFGPSNNYAGSYVDHVCTTFGCELCDVVGEENLIEHVVDLTSDDGMKDYGCVKRRASLLTCEQYRKYVGVLDMNRIDKWWWLATAWSTPAHGSEIGCKCVSPSGGIFIDFYFRIGVRPFCIFNSSIFVSVEEG